MRRLPLIGGATAVAILLGYLVVWIGVSPVRQRGTDFSVDYVAAQLIREGRGDSLYDRQLEARLHAAILPPDTVFDLPYIGPPTAALLTVPVTMLDPQAAYRLWSVLQFLMLAAVAAIAVRCSRWGPRIHRADRLAVGALALATPATVVLVLMGQWDGLLALALACGWAALQARRPAMAGLVVGLAFGATKPHLALGLAVFLLARRDWRALAGTGAAAVIVALASLAVAGTAGIGEFAGAIGGALANTPPASTVGLTGLVSSWLGSGHLTVALVVAGSLLALGGCAVLGHASRRPDGLAPALGGAVALSLLLAPHVLDHDLVLLVPVMVWCTAWHTQRHGAGLLAPMTVWLALSCLVAVDAGNGAAAPPGRVVPLALAGLGGTAVRLGWRQLRSTGSAAAQPA